MCANLLGRKIADIFMVWKRQLFKATTWKKVRGPAGAVRRDRSSGLGGPFFWLIVGHPLPVVSSRLNVEKQVFRHLNIEEVKDSMPTEALKHSNVHSHVDEVGGISSIVGQ